MSVIARIEGLSAGYDGNRILHEVSMEIGQGELICLLGRNGVGKTTLALAMMGLLRLSAGTIQFAGQDTSNWPPYRLARAGMALVPQSRRLFKSLTVRQNLEVAARERIHGRVGWDAHECFEHFENLARRRDTPAGLLSGGEQQMLAISRAMVSRPLLLVLDEPTEGLAPLLVEQVASVLRTIRSEGASIFLIEQNIGMGLAVADRAYIMSKGRVVAQGTAAEMREDKEVLRRHLGAQAG